MQFTNGGHRAFESLMRDKPGSDHYDSGVYDPYEVSFLCIKNALLYSVFRGVCTRLYQESA